MHEAVSRRLLRVIQARVRDMGGDDEVLPEYVLVMVENGKTESQISVELDAFLGGEAQSFAAWLWDEISAATADAGNKPSTSSAAESRQEPGQPHGEGALASNDLRQRLGKGKRVGRGDVSAAASPPLGCGVSSSSCSRGGDGRRESAPSDPGVSVRAKGGARQHADPSSLTLDELLRRGPLQQRLEAGGGGGGAREDDATGTGNWGGPPPQQQYGGGRGGGSWHPAVWHAGKGSGKGGHGKGGRGNWWGTGAAVAAPLTSNTWVAPGLQVATPPRFSSSSSSSSPRFAPYARPQALPSTTMSKQGGGGGRGGGGGGGRGGGAVKSAGWNVWRPPAPTSTNAAAPDPA
jgi:hypothetical protein